MKTYNLFILITFLLLTMKSKADIVPIRHGEKVGVRLQEIGVQTDQLVQRLTSGLTSTVVVSIQLMMGEVEKFKTNAMMRIQYDLWEEVYLLKSVGGYELPQKKLKGSHRAINYLRNLEFKDLFPVNQLNRENRYYWNISIVLQPMTKEQKELIQKWISKNLVQVDAFGNRKSGISRKNQIIEAIFSGVAEDGTNRSVWHAQERSQAFKIGDLKNEK